MSQSSELISYVKRLGENINVVYTRLEKIEAKIDSVSEDLGVVKEGLESNKIEINELRESLVKKSEFDEFVKKLTESFSEILPPALKQTEEIE